MSRDPDAVAQLLEPGRTSPERIAGLLGAGFTEEQIGLACGASVAVVSRWKRKESVPDPAQARRLNELRRLCLFAIQITQHNLERAMKMLLLISVQKLVAEERFPEVDQALYHLQRVEERRLAAQT